LQMSDML